MPPPGPRVTCDIIIHPEKDRRQVVLVRRRFAPLGWALPGGFVDVGETVEDAAMREAREETGLEVALERQFHTYSDPARDPRGHTVSVVFVGTAGGEPQGGDDAAEARAFLLADLPAEMAFDHRAILNDYLNRRY